MELPAGSVVTAYKESLCGTLWFSCTLEFGFIESEFVGVEQLEPYIVELAYFSGAGGGFPIVIEFVAGTASK